MRTAVDTPDSGSTQIVRVIEAEFREMPGMRLTDAQIRRLWNLPADVCDSLLKQMCRVGTLRQDAKGRYYHAPAT